MEKIKISHPDKILFPESEITKGDIVNYYLKISEFILPHLQGRPASIQRFPNGISEKGFYQKEVADYFPTYIKRIKVKLRSEEKKEFISIENQESLTYLANLGAIPFHPWLSCKGNLNKPDMLIWDFDPSDDDFEKVRRGAFFLYELLISKNINPFLKTTGSRGLHIIIPLKPEQNFLKIRTLAKKISAKISKLNPELLTTEFGIADRGNKVFVDYFRNSFGQTAIAPYSVRPIENAPVAAPLLWEELQNKSINAQSFTIKNMLSRLQTKGDLFHDFYLKPYTYKELLSVL